MKTQNIKSEIHDKITVPKEVKKGRMKTINWERSKIRSRKNVSHLEPEEL